MFEKVNPAHPDKVADRIAGAVVDIAYDTQIDPKVAVEVLIGHGTCHIIAETSEHFTDDEVRNIVWRITASPLMKIDYVEVPQDVHLAENQDKEARCGDNGIFKGVPVSEEEKTLSKTIRRLYEQWPSDGKFIYDMGGRKFIACQSNCDDEAEFKCVAENYIDAATFILNPLGYWTGGTDVDTGATNRKLGSDMGRAVTGGGLHGKDLSKADVAVNIVCHIMAQDYHTEIIASCAIGDGAVNFVRESDGYVDIVPYSAVLEIAAGFINELGGFEKLAEWGLF